ncbi:hypothetical protein [Microbacterium sp. UFMG61]|uniref:hypothetical protein n=1 Tax=Microbacterium sp. UFMG61 TaxID=2745935 RepID=UPI00188F9118|nr:hypothetical protein [Microbacterium sp. UFMG61]
MDDGMHHTTPSRRARRLVGVVYVVVPLLAAIGLLTPVLALTTSPLGVHDGAAIPLIAIYILCVLVPALGSIPAVSARLPRTAVLSLASMSGVICIAWTAFFCWSLTLVSGAGGIELVRSPPGFLAVLISATTSVWAVALSALVMTIPRQRVRAVVLVTAILLGLGVLIASTAVATS